MTRPRLAVTFWARAKRGSSPKLWMKTRKRRPAEGKRRAFAVCVQNHGYEASLERHKLYVVRPDAAAHKDGDLRVVDESGEDYLYPADWFVLIEVPKSVQASLLKTS